MVFGAGQREAPSTQRRPTAMAAAAVLASTAALGALLLRSAPALSSGQLSDKLQSELPHGFRSALMHLDGMDLADVEKASVHTGAKRVVWSNLNDKAIMWHKVDGSLQHGQPGALDKDTDGHFNIQPQKHDTEPSSTCSLGISFEAPVDTIHDGGQMIYGNFIAPQTADYTFSISSDDGGELWFGHSESSAEVIAKVDSFLGRTGTDEADSTQQSTRQYFEEAKPREKKAVSAAIHLVKGTQYFIQAIEVNRQGRDALSVAVSGGPFTSSEPIPATLNGHIVLSYKSKFATALSNCEFPESAPSPPEPKMIGETGKATVSHSAVTVRYSGSYTTPVVIIGMPSFRGHHAVVARIEKSTASEMSFYLDEPRCMDAWHAQETASWMVIEAGAHGIDSEFQAGLLETHEHHDNGFDWNKVTFPTPMHEPVVVSQIQTHNGAHYVKTRQQRVTGSGFEVRMEEDTGDRGHVQETIGWLAMKPGVGRLGAITYEAASISGVSHRDKTYDLTASFVSHPLVFGSIATFVGHDPCELRMKSMSGNSIKFFIEEDTCVDREKFHANEHVGLIATGTGTISV